MKEVEHSHPTKRIVESAARTLTMAKVIKHVAAKMRIPLSG